MASKGNVTDINTIEDGEQNIDSEQLLMNEDELISGLLRATEFKSDESLIKKAQIKRNGKLMFEFRIRPLEEEESQRMRKECTARIPNPNGRHLPKVDGDTNYVRLRSMKIYEATVAEDRKRLWDNEKVKKQLNTLDPLNVIDLALMAGEKDAVCDLIDSVSGYGTSVEDYAKN